MGGLEDAPARSAPPSPSTGPARRPTSSHGPVAWLPRILAAVVVLYGLQVLYSADFSKGLQDVCFFYVPFAVAYGLLSDFKWDRKLLTWVLWVVAIEAVLFVLVGSVEYLTRGLFWNHQVIRSNEFHTYFRVNSVFWDPNIYGRYLALAIVVAMAALLWAKERRTFALLTGSGRRSLDRAGADLLAVELHRLAGGPGGAGGAALEPEVDRRRGGSRRSRRDPRRAAGRRRWEGQHQQAEHRHQRPGPPRLRRHPPLRPAPPLRLRLRLLLHRLPRPRAESIEPQSPSPTPSR